MFSFAHVEVRVYAVDGVVRLRMHYVCSQRLDLLCVSVSVEPSPLCLLSDAMRRVV